MSGRKDDTGKRDLSLVPRVAVDALAEALEVGARKYSRMNYAAGLEAHRMVSAMLRHVFAWYEGEERDPDGQLHLGSVMANCAMILHQQQLGTLKDDRFNPSTLPRPAETATDEIVAGVIKGLELL